MRDIRRPYRNSKSSGGEIIKGSVFRPSDSKEVERKAEMFERNEYKDVEYTREGKPVMRASSHFDMSKGMSRRKRSDFDLLKREEFFNSKRREFDEEDVKVYKKARNKKKRRKNFILTAILALAIAGLLAATYIFDSATVTVNPKYKDIDVADTFLIFKEDTLMDMASSSLSKDIPKSAPKEVNQKASGEITIYNNYSASPQILIKNTRFQTSDGKVFRIGDSVTVPGKSGNTPGSIKAKVSADAYGSEYNIGPTDFTIPGFKDTPRYEGFYAKSTSPMTGGASGMIQIVSKDDIETANVELKPAINKNIQTLYSKFSHEGYYTLYGAPILVYEDNSSSLMNSGENSYTVTGIANIVSIKKDTLAKMIARQVLKDNYSDSEGVRLENIDNLSFAIDPETDVNSNILKININGKARLIWTYHEEELKELLKNRKLSLFQEVINNFNYAILNASYKVFPIWSRSFPSSVKKIKIVEDIN